MSVITTNTSVGVADLDSPTNDRRQRAAPADDRVEVARGFANELVVGGEPVAVDEFVARVLDRAHRVACAHAAPDEARVILELAQLFADELAKSNVRFDRLRF